MRLAQANEAVRQARKALAQALDEQSKIVNAQVACRFCKAPKGHPCHKGNGVHTRSHTERRTDAR
jgi:hypothetical protein